MTSNYEQERERLREELLRAEQPIVSDLMAAGRPVSSVWDLVNTSSPYPEALPILMDHLERGGYPRRIMEGLARALAVKPAYVYWDRIVAVLNREKTKDDRVEGLLVALAVIARKENLADLQAMFNDEALGVWRAHLMPPLRKLGGESSRDLLASAINNPGFGREAAAQLRLLERAARK